MKFSDELQPSDTIAIISPLSSVPAQQFVYIFVPMTAAFLQTMLRSNNANDQQNGFIDFI